MNFKIRDLCEEDIKFVSEVYSENIEALHGVAISLEDWKECFFSNIDDDERNFIVLYNDEKAAWLKLNGLKNDRIYISMLVVRKNFQRRGVGSYAVRFTEKFAKDLKRNTLPYYIWIPNLSPTRPRSSSGAITAPICSADIFPTISPT